MTRPRSTRFSLPFCFIAPSSAVSSLPNCRLCGRGVLRGLRGKPCLCVTSGHIGDAGWGAGRARDACARSVLCDMCPRTQEKDECAEMDSWNCITVSALPLLHSHEPTPRTAHSHSPRPSPTPRCRRTHGRLSSAFGPSRTADGGPGYRQDRVPPGARCHACLYAALRLPVPFRPYQPSLFTQGCHRAYP